MTTTPGKLPARAHIKREPADWRVHEQLDFAFSGTGEHAYFYVEKENLNTADVARALAQACEVAVHDVGFAGLKDKHAVTRQWFSVAQKADQWPLQLSGTRCLDVQRHARKLRRGEHSLNHFEIRLRDLENVDAAHLALLGAGFANFFGPQRTSSSNVEQALSWLARGQWGRQSNRARRSKRPAQRGAGRRGWHLSVLRSMLFNEVLSRRVELGNHADTLDGDILQDGVPTGPLWGRGRTATLGVAAQIESLALQPHAGTCEALEYAGVDQGRRKFAQQPLDFAVERLAGDDMLLRFDLPPGAYATALLAHTLTVVDDSGPTGRSVGAP